MKTIVFPTDFSENSIKALEFAVKYLSSNNTEFIVVHIFQMPSANVSGTFYLFEEIKKQAESDMKDFIAELNQRFANNFFTNKVVHGDFDSGCNSIAIQNNADCIIMGTKGASGIKEALIGSNTASLMKELKVPLFVVPFKAIENSIDDFIFCYDGTEIKSSSNKSISKFSNWFNLPVKAKHIKTKENNGIENWENLNQLFGKNEFQTNEISADDFEIGFKSIIENEKGILCMIRHKKSFWENLFNQSDSRKAVMHTNIPVLVIPE
jgi:nucleotide-binding universal stress UspA family protein